MNTITIKIVSWEEDGNSLICKFASDETASSNPDDYQGYAFQPNFMWPHATTAEQVLKEVAQAGLSVCDEIKKSEDLAKDAAQLTVYKGLAGEQRTYNVADLSLSSIEAIDPVDPDALEV